MISRTILLENLRLDLGSKLMNLISNEFINRVLTMRVLPRFSDWYPLLCDIRIKKENAIPYRNYNNIAFNYAMYRIPKQFDVPWVDVNEEFIWRDLENYQILGNDSSDIYTGGNFLLQACFLSSRSAMPHTRSYFIVKFQEPDLIIVEPPQQVHKDFHITMQAQRTLKTIPKNMETWFIKYFVETMKYAIYNDEKFNAGSQTYAGIEIDTKIDDLRDSTSEIEKCEETFERDYYKNPERFQTICLYLTKGM